MVFPIWGSHIGISSRRDGADGPGCLATGELKGIGVGENGMDAAPLDLDPFGEDR